MLGSDQRSTDVSEIEPSENPAAEGRAPERDSEQSVDDNSSAGQSFRDTIPAAVPEWFTFAAGGPGSLPFTFASSPATEACGTWVPTSYPPSAGASRDDR